MNQSLLDSVRLPAWSSILKAQIRQTLGVRRKLGWFLLALIVAQIVALGSSGVVFGLHVSATSSSQGSGVEVQEFAMGSLEDFDLGDTLDEGLAAIWLAGISSLFWALLWPIRVWSSQPPPRRDYHWAMPIRRSHHDLTRVLAGGVWVLIVSAALVLCAIITATVFGHTDLFPRLSLWFWLNLLIAPLMLYTFTSILYVRVRSRPSAWLWGGFWAAGMVLTVVAMVAPDLVGPWARSATFNPLRTLLGPLFGEISATSVTNGTEQVLGWLLWSSVFSTGLWIAANTRSKRL